MNETSGVLKPVVEAYLNGRVLNDREVALMRAYLQQWIDADAWRGVVDLEDLRVKLPAAKTRLDLDQWLEDAEALGIDPL